MMSESNRVPRGTVTLAERAKARVTVITLVGEHDLATRADLIAALDTAARRSRHIMIDLSACTFIDCCALGTILRRASIRLIEIYAPETTAGTVLRLLEFLQLRAQTSHEFPLLDAAEATRPAEIFPIRTSRSEGLAHLEPRMRSETTS